MLANRLARRGPAAARRLVAILSGLLLASAGAAAPAPPDAGALARRWDHINFEIQDPDLARSEADALAQDAEALAKSRPGQAEPLIWEAAADLAKADAHHDLSSLSLADRARRLLEDATARGVSGEDGGFAFAVLGTLYGEMPGFPLSYGDRDKARADFQRALALAPANIEVNVLYGDFLLHQRDFPGAMAAAHRALNAPARPGRPVGDRYRRQEATELLAKAEEGRSR
jgi:tetratricopeptide (TPR) repeat protein